MYSLEKKNSNYDYCKRQILAVQENFKVFVPLSALLLTGLLALDITNAFYNYMAVYVCVIVNIAGIAAACGITVSLIKQNRRQRNLFAQLSETADSGNVAVKVMKCVSDSSGVISRARLVRVSETEKAYIIMPQLSEYKHRLFTRYDFRGDFGRLILPKEEYAATEEENGLRFVSADCEFGFETVNK